MLACLRHYTFVGSYDEQDGINSPDASQHVMDEPFMTGHIHDREFPSAWEG